YAEWALSMKGALAYATLWDVVSGSEPSPSASDQDHLKLWLRRDGAACNMIIRALAP
ncbi:hypothetical protein LXA43DRAFT_836812, partial [Ganoderma leucocontextum]